MAVFKRKKVIEEGKTKKVIGAYVSQSLIEYLSLYSMAHGVSNASLIEEQLLIFRKKKEEEGFLMDSLIKSLAATAINIYENLDNKEEISFESFTADLRIELRSKKELSQNTCKLILKHLLDGTDEKENNTIS
jgi:hypothetical protein